MSKEGHPDTSAHNNSWTPDSPPHTKNPTERQKYFKTRRRLQAYTFTILLAATTAVGTIKPANPERNTYIPPERPRIELAYRPAKEHAPPIQQLRKIKSGAHLNNKAGSELQTNSDNPATKPELNRKPFHSEHHAKDNKLNLIAAEPSPAQQVQIENKLAINHEAIQQHGPYALEAPTQIHDDVIYAIVNQYRGGDQAANAIAHAIIENKDQYNINAEIAMTGFMIQEGSFHKVTGNLSGDFNLGNIRNPHTGQFADYSSWDEGVDAIFRQLHRYLRVWPTERGITGITNLEAALYTYAPPFENPTDTRIKVAKAFIDEIRALSERYERGEITKEQLVQEVYNIRIRLQKHYGPSWV